MLTFLINFVGIVYAVTERYYYVMAEEVLWDYAPSWPTNPLTGIEFGEDEKVFVADFTSGGYIGRQYMKALYFEYTDSTFTTRKTRPDWEKHLGFMGPVIRAEVGDTVYVTFKNNGTHPYSMHPHGLASKNISVGVSDQDGSFVADLNNGVQPGATHVYTWEAKETSGPIPGSDISSINWWYHSDGGKAGERNAGLIGPIVICAKGMCDKEAKPLDVNIELFNIFTVIDESASVLLEKNINVFFGGTPSDTQAFHRSNKMHTMNGYVYGNWGTQVPVGIIKGEHARWYLLAVGKEVDLTTVNWQGNTIFTTDKLRSDVEGVIPAYATTVDMIPNLAGKWLYRCDDANHISAGMIGYYTVYECDPNTRSCSGAQEWGRIELESTEYLVERRRTLNDDKDEEVCLDCLDDEIRFAKLEAAVEALTQQVSALQNENIQTKAKLAVTYEAFKSLKGASRSSWTLKRTKVLFHNLEKITLHQKTMTYIETLPLPLPDNTRAVMISFFCNFWNGDGHAYLDVDIHQKGNEEGGVATIENTHYRVYANTFYYEIFVPWDNSISDKIVFDVTRSYHTGGDKNWYRLRLVGYVVA